jgi:hypothetical protein
LTVEPPTFSTLVSLVLNELSAAEARSVLEAAEGDPATRQTIELLREVLPPTGATRLPRPLAQARRRVLGLLEPDPPAATSGRREVVAAIVFDSRRETLAGVRGPAAPVHLLYEHEGVSVDLQLQPPDQSDDPRAIRGQLAADARADVEVTLCDRDGAVVAQARTDRQGRFAMAAAAGAYALRIELDGAALVLPGVELA